MAVRPSWVMQLWGGALPLAPVYCHVSPTCIGLTLSISCEFFKISPFLLYKMLQHVAIVYLLKIRMIKTYA